MHYHINTSLRKLVADLDTPVNVFLKLREHFPGCIFFQDSTHSEKANQYSYIGCLPISGITISNGNITEKYPDGTLINSTVVNKIGVPEVVMSYISKFRSKEEYAYLTRLFGHICYDAVKYFEDIDINEQGIDEKDIPLIQLNLYRYMLVFDHFNNELHIAENNLEHESTYGLDILETIIREASIDKYPFKLTNEEKSNFSDNDFLKIVEKGKAHCHRGDVFQLVLSRLFMVDFIGDDMNVFRKLRAVSPSPYSYYFDYEDYRLFGASPETQLKVFENKAILHPIAGTYKRTGNNSEDDLLANKLKVDSKENAEHVMLVDLARNDLSKHYRDVSVTVYKAIQYYSHVMHMVSEVTGTNKQDSSSPFHVLIDSFPAGTLSGAPKYRALQLIDQYENCNRGFYGGCIGYIGLAGDVNMAIMIRSVLSKNNKLIYQAGAGVVATSIEENELQEVNNKVAGIRTAINLANIEK